MVPAGSDRILLKLLSNVGCARERLEEVVTRYRYLAQIFFAVDAIYGPGAYGTFFMLNYLHCDSCGGRKVCVVPVPAFVYSIESAPVVQNKFRRLSNIQTIFIFRAGGFFVKDFTNT
jgi:hypothetical protein